MNDNDALKTGCGCLIIGLLFLFCPITIPIALFLLMIAIIGFVILAFIILIGYLIEWFKRMLK